MQIDLHLKIGPVLEIRRKDRSNESKIANMTEKGHSHKFSNFNIDGIFGNHNTLLALVSLL